jgi:lysophospholipase L1-like esterase
MAIQLKRNDTKDTISYTMTYADGTPVNLTGATVRFVMGKGKTLITSDTAIIVSATAGKVEYTLKENDTLLAGNYNAEFEVTFSTGKVKTFPNDGYISIKIQPNVDGEQSTYIEDQIAYRVSDIQILKNSIQAQLDQFAAGATNAETSQARVEADGTTNTTLKARLDKKEAKFASDIQTLSSSVAQKATKGELTGSDLKTSSDADKLKLINLSDEVKQAMAGTTPINASVAAKGITEEKYARQSIQAEHTNFLTLGKNIFNKATATSGYYVLYTNGTLLVNAGYYASDFIPVKPNTVYSYSGVKNDHFAFYDENRTYISNTTNVLANPFTTPANAYYVRVSIQTGNINTAQIELGSTPSAFEPFKFILSSYTDLLKTLPLKAMTTAYLEDLVSRYTYTKNLFNKATITDNNFIAWTNGLLSANTSYYASDFIPVQPNTAYAITATSHMAEYGSGKNFITGRQSGTYGTTFTTGANTYFVRISPQKANVAVDAFQVEVGTTSTAYEKFGLIQATTVNGIPVIGSSANGWKNKIWSSMGTSITQGNSFQPKVSAVLGLQHFNFGVGGTKIADTSGTDTTAMCRDERINTLNSASDLITAEGGTNDWANNVPLGTIDDIVTTTFYGAVKTMIEKLVTRFPSKRIVLITTPYGLYPNRAGWTDTTGYKNQLGLTTGDYGKVIMEVARMYGIPCVDIYNLAGWNKINISTFITNDGAYLHPNDEGGKRIAEALTGFLKSLEPIA